MSHPNLKARRLAVILTILGAAVLVSGTRIRAADTDFPIYFPDSKLVLEPATLSQTVYLPVIDIIQHMALPYTDALALETLTVRSGGSRLVATRNSALISIDDQIVLLGNPVIREDGRWLAPIDFLSLGISKITGIPFRYRPGSSRLFAGDVQAPELAIDAQTRGPSTRVTLRAASPVNLELVQDEPNRRATLLIDPVPVDPTREQIDYRDRLIRSIAFTDVDGPARIVLDLTADVLDVRITAAEGNRLFFVDVARRTDTTTTQPTPTEETARPGADAPGLQRRVRVIVIDPGHGGTDAGARSATVAEKDLTLAIGRRLRATLQTRIGATVLLTRDSDIDLNNEARSAIANNNRADVFVSLHIGYSHDPLASESSIFAMQDNFAGPAAVTSRSRLFLPWYSSYKTSYDSSLQIAKLLQEEFNRAIPAWDFPVRTAPLGVLASATMPAILLEIGNLNNPVNTQTLLDRSFQNRLAATIAGAIERLSIFQTAVGRPAPFVIRAASN